MSKRTLSDIGRNTRRKYTPKYLFSDPSVKENNDVAIRNLRRIAMRNKLPIGIFDQYAHNPDVRMYYDSYGNAEGDNLLGSYAGLGFRPVWTKYHGNSHISTTRQGRRKSKKTRRRKSKKTKPHKSSKRKRL